MDRPINLLEFEAAARAQLSDNVFDYYASGAPRSADAKWLHGVVDVSRKTRRIDPTSPLAGGSEALADAAKWIASGKVTVRNGLDNALVEIAGTKNADNWDDLVDDDGLDNPLNLTEKGTEPPVTSPDFFCFDLPVVFTGTSPGGHGGGGHCDHWTSTIGGYGSSVGRRTLTAAQWSYGCSGPDCDKLAPIYCFEQ